MPLISMKRRDALGAVSTTVLIGIAGCASDSNEQSNAENQSETTKTEATPEETVGPDNIEYPSGYSKDGIEDWSKAKESLRGALGDKSFRYQLQAENAAGTTIEYTATVEPSDEEVFSEQIRKNSGDEKGFEQYAYTSDGQYTKVVDREGETSYRTDDTEFEGARYPFHWRYFEEFKFTLEEVSKKNGEIWIRYTSDELTESAEEGYGEEWGDERYSELILTNDGLIRGGEMILGEKGATEKWGHVRVAIDSLGEAVVEKPEWLDEAKSSTTN